MKSVVLNQVALDELVDEDTSGNVINFSDAKERKLRFSEKNSAVVSTRGKETYEDNKRLLKRELRKYFGYKVYKLKKLLSLKEEEQGDDSEDLTLYQRLVDRYPILIFPLSLALTGFMYFLFRLTCWIITLK